MSAAERIAAYAELAEIAEPDEAIVWIDLMENLSRQTGDEAGIIAAMYKRAMYYYVAGTLEDFLDASGAVAPLLLEAGDRRYVFTEILVIKRLIAEGRTETASRAARKFLEVAGESDSRYMEGYANYGIGLTCQAGGYLDESATRDGKRLRHPAFRKGHRINDRTFYFFAPDFQETSPCGPSSPARTARLSTRRQKMRPLPLS